MSSEVGPFLFDEGHKKAYGSPLHQERLGLVQQIQQAACYHSSYLGSRVRQRETFIVRLVSCSYIWYMHRTQPSQNSKFSGGQQRVQQQRFSRKRFY